MLEQFVDRLSELPLAFLYPALAFFAFLENIFPPLPTDAVVAFGSFLAARGHGNPWVSFLVTWLGNLLGAAVMFGVGHHYGHSIFTRTLVRWGGPEADARLTQLYARYGVVSLFLSRFLPGIRALVPVFAGAARLPFVSVMAIIAIASGLWYGFLAFIAYRAAEDWDTLRAMIDQYNRAISAVAVLTAAGLLAVWWWRRKHAARTTELTTSGRLQNDRANE